MKYLKIEVIPSLPLFTKYKPAPLIQPMTPNETSSDHSAKFETCKELLVTFSLSPNILLPVMSLCGLFTHMLKFSTLEI